MHALPSPESLASLVSQTTEMMFGMSFSLENSGENKLPWLAAPPWQAIALSIEGERDLTVVVAADDLGAAALSSAMFSCSAQDVDKEMVKDSLGELANIVAGQVKTLLALDQSLGLPRMLTTADALTQLNSWQSATLRSPNAEARVWVAITEGDA